jgi:hypothetical protein
MRLASRTIGRPRTDAAQLIVSAQMLLDLAIIEAVVRLLLDAARVSPAEVTSVD